MAAAGVFSAEKKMPTNRRKSFNITCASNKPKVLTTKASLPMIASLRADLENVSFGSDCSYFVSSQLECRTGARIAAMLYATLVTTLLCWEDY